MVNSILIWGASGHAKVVAQIFRRTSRVVAGFVDTLSPERKGEAFCSSLILGGEEEFASLYNSGIRRAIIGFGDNLRRVEAARRLQGHGFELESAIDPTAVIADDITIGAGSVVCAGAVVNTGARIGTNVIVNTGAIVEHDCVVDDGAHISPGANLAGGVTVRRCAWICIGATVVEKVEIGANSIVGAGAVVLKEVPGGVVVAGVPARVIRKATNS